MSKQTTNLKIGKWISILCYLGNLLNGKWEVVKIPKPILYDVEKKLYPPVIDAILNDRVFDFQDLFKSSCHANSSCGGGCSKCHN